MATPETRHAAQPTKASPMAGPIREPGHVSAPILRIGIFLACMTMAVAA